MQASVCTVSRNLLNVFSKSRKFATTEGLQIIKMPNIMNSKEGTVQNWAIKVGDSFRKGDRLCDIVLPVATIGIDAKSDGIMANIVVGRYETAPADSPIALYALSKDYYMGYLAESMQNASDAAKMEIVTAAEEEEKPHKPDAADLMRVIRQMTQQGRIESGSVFAKKLQSLARKGNKELLAAFEASYEGASFNQETFDEGFFLENAKDIIDEDDHSD